MSGPPYLPGRREIGNYRVHRGERGGRWPVRTIGVDPARPGPPRMRTPRCYWQSPLAIQRSVGPIEEWWSWQSEEEWS